MEKQPVAGSGAISLQSDVDGLRKAIIRFSSGRVLRTYISAEEESFLYQSAPATFAARTPDGNRVEVKSSEVKAIFFVKSFEGAADYSEFKVFTAQPNGRGVWVRIHFHDGEIMEGVAPNRIDTYVKPVFSMTPPDPASNNQTVLVSKQSLQEMQILGLAAD
ncbi:MAG: hypothetical protein ACE145_03970 [Terriglobia bacterium]